MSVASSALSSAHDETQADLIGYAQDALDEVLGWYGLKSTVTPTLNVGGPLRVGPRTPTEIVRTPSKSPPGTESVDGTASSGAEDGPDKPLDLTATSLANSPADSLENSHHSHNKRQQQKPVPAVRATGYNSSLTNTSGTTGTQKKLVGIRYLFPPFDDRTTLLDRAHVWVARHDHRYFVDWTEAELTAVDPSLRPYSPISRDVYKLHMNRSEYCRNVKLKYCLMSDAPWAKAFREKLQKSPPEGGFTGLCQAKIAAAELWRAYSENYRSHQARHPTNHHNNNNNNNNNVSKNQQVINDLLAVDGSQGNWKQETNTSTPNSETPTEKVLKRSADQRPFSEQRTTSNNVSSSAESNRPEDDSTNPAAEDNERAAETEEHVPKTSSEEECPTIADGVDANPGDCGSSDEGTKSIGKLVENCGRETPGSSTEMSDEGCGSRDWMTMMHCRDSSERGALDNEDDGEPMDMTTFDDDAVDRVSLSSNEMASDLRVVVRSEDDRGLSTPTLTPRSAVAGPPSMPSPRTRFDFCSGSDRTSNGGNAVEYSSENHPSSRQPPVATSKASKKSASGKAVSKTGESSSLDYRRSERGLSFLFPSFSDHGMTLADKVRVTVSRHKNNYFLGWSEDELRTLDPIVRPKIPVTPEIYREYCHRNAMKYDSNLQFACESPEPWAVDFRSRLTLPPAEGGFSSLCEVKLEAGRLWREHSGRYRMHNIVKWQMGMNNAVLTNGSTVSAAQREPRRPTTGKTSSFSPPAAVKSDAESTMSVPFCGSVGPSTFKSNSLSVAAAFQTDQQRRTLHGSPPSTMPGLLPLMKEDAANIFQADLRNTLMNLSTAHGWFQTHNSFPRGVYPVLPVAPAVAPAHHGGPVAGALSSLTQHCAAALDMSSKSSSTTITSPPPSLLPLPQSHLFAPLPASMSPADQLLVWLERHRAGYYVGARNLDDCPPPSMASVEPELVIPRRFPVTPELFCAHVPDKTVEVLTKVHEVMSTPDDDAEPEAVRRFRRRLRAAPGSADAYATFEDAVAEALRAWTLLQSTRDHSSSLLQSCRRLSRRKRRRDTSSGCSAIYEQNGKQLRQQTSTVDDCSNSYLDHERLADRRLLTLSAARRVLWAARSDLHAAVADATLLGWTDRLAPVHSTLKAGVGADYTPPPQSSSAAVDLVLAVLDSRLEEATAVGESDALSDG